MSWTIQNLMAPQRALPSAETIRQTVDRLAQEQRIWTGLSGEILTGVEVADHLTAAREWLADKGWAPRARRSISAALIHTAPGGPDDKDTSVTAQRLLDLILQARANLNQHVDYSAWESRAHRSHAEVAQLMRDASQFARECGPSGGGRRG